MWVARPSPPVALAKADVLGRPDGYMRRRTCQRCKAVNSKKLLPVLVQKQVAFAMLLVAVCPEGTGRPSLPIAAAPLSAVATANKLAAKMNRPITPPFRLTA